MESMQQILPSGGLASFHNEVSKLADLGRYEDAYIVHAAEGETVVPMQVFDENPGLKEMLFAQMREMGIQPERYIVGSQFNSINPITGQPEFFLKKIFKEAKKALKKVAPYAGLIAGVAGLGPGYAALAGGIGGLYGSGGDLGAGAMGALSGYGAGKAFGQAEMFGGDPGQYALRDLFSSGESGGLGTAFKRVGANLGFGGNDVQLSKDAIENSREFSAYKLKIGDGATVDGFIKSTDVDSLAKIGSEAASKMTGGDYLTTAALLTPIYQALKAEEDDKETTEMEDITGMYPWGGSFKDTMAIDPITGQPVTYSAEGGIVQHFQEGTGPFGVIYPEGDTDFDASDMVNQPGDESIQDLDLFMGDDMAMNERADEEGIMMAMNTQEMITVFDKETGNVVTITRAEFLANPSRYSMAPNEQEGFQYDFDVDGENRTYSFDEPGLTDQAKQEFLDREGITQIRSFPEERVVSNLDAIIQRITEDPTRMGALIQSKGGNITNLFNLDKDSLAYTLAKARKSSGRLNSDDIQRAAQDLNVQMSDMKSVLVKLNTIREEIADALEDKKFIAEQSKRRDYLGPRSEMGVEEQGDLGMADGGIAYLAEGSFPRRTGAIAGPGGPKDDRVPAMLSEGEFVMTAEAGRNAGGGSRREGAKKMYNLMNRLEGVA